MTDKKDRTIFTIKKMFEELSNNEIAYLFLKELTELGAIYKYYEPSKEDKINNFLHLHIALPGKFDIKVRFKDDMKSKLN